MKNYLRYTSALLFTLLLTLAGCRGEYEIIYSSSHGTELGAQVLEGQEGQLVGFYLLNEGNMGSNKASLDYFDFTKGVYHRNIYAEANPNVVKELGDVGNDVAIYGSKLYAVINVSNYIEVMDAKTAKHIGKIEIPNARYVAFHKGKLYASAYVAPVKFDENARVGAVYEVDTATLQVERMCKVGYQPEEMVITRGRLYVANSGGYMFPNYDRTISVVDLDTFEEVKKIDVGINLHRLRLTSSDQLLVTSRGDYYDTGSSIYFIDPNTDEVVDHMDLPVSNLDIVGDLACFYAVSWSHNTQSNTISYGVLNTRTKEIVTRNFIKDGTEEDIRIPYGVRVNPINGDIYVTDAIDYVTPGTLLCYDKYGMLRWKVDTGDIPAHICFLYEKRE